MQLEAVAQAIFGPYARVRFWEMERDHVVGDANSPLKET